MATNEMTWRKMPRNIITDPNMDYIASCLPQQYSSAPYMFYMTALSVADDDGIFDIEDGIIFSRLMHVDSVEIVFKIANLMMKRKIITRNGETSICMLTNWEYSIRDKTPRTLEDRRIIVQKQIAAAAAAKSKEFSLDPAETEAGGVEFTVDFSTTPKPDDDFLCPDDDKIAENVVKNYQTEKIREDKNREIEKNTHRIDTDIEALRATATALRTKDEQKDTKEYTEWDGTETGCSNEMADLVRQAFECQQAPIIDEHKKRLFNVFEQFFAKNCLGFNANEHTSQIWELCNRVIKLSDDKNPAEIIASCLLSQFKKLTEDEGYYNGVPITPEELLKNGAYKHSLAACSRILLTNKQINSQWAEQLELQKEIEQEKEQVGDVFTDEYIKYGIDPQDPNKAALLVRAKSANGSP